VNPDEADASGDQPHAGGNIERSKWSRDACGQSAGSTASAALLYVTGAFTRTYPALDGRLKLPGSGSRSGHFR
jgi:hypothetical protein